jgi:hypothetical protein
MLQATAAAMKKLAVVIGETGFEWLLLLFIPECNRKLGEPTLEPKPSMTTTFAVSFLDGLLATQETVSRWSPPIQETVSR